MSIMSWAKRQNTTKFTISLATLCATLAFSQMAEAACQWNLEGRVVRDTPLQTDEGTYSGPGYPVEMMAMVRWRDITLCMGNTCPWNTTNWIPTTSDDKGNFTIPSIPLVDPTCQFERDFILMMQAPDVGITSWQEVASRNGVDGPTQPSGPVPWPTFFHVVEFGNITLDDLPLPDWYEEEVEANNGVPDVGNATMEPASDNGHSFPTGTLEPNTNPFPLPDKEEDEGGFPHGTLEPNTHPFPLPNEEEDEGGFPTGTLEPNTHPFPLPDDDGDEEDESEGNDQGTDDEGNETGDGANDESDDTSDTNDTSDSNDSAPDLTDVHAEEAPPCLPMVSTVAPQADFAFGPHPSGTSTGISLDGLVRIQPRHSGNTPMARRLSVTFEVQNHDARFVERSGDCPVEVQLRFNEGPGAYGEGEDAWHTYEDDMPTINANWQRFITMSATIRGTGNDTNSDWNEIYEYVRVEVILDHTNGVSEANEGDNSAGIYCYHATSNAFVDMGSCDAAEGAFD